MSAKLTDIPETLRKCDGAWIDDVIGINHRPHPFTVGTAHVVYASDHNGGILDESVMTRIPCMASIGGRLCGGRLADHTCDTVAVVKQSRDMTREEMHAFLKAIADLNIAGLDGFIFVDTGYKITNREVDNA